MSNYRNDGTPDPRGRRNNAHPQSGTNGRTVNGERFVQGERTARNRPAGQTGYAPSDTASRTRTSAVPTATRLMETPPAHTASGSRSTTVGFDTAASRTRQVGSGPSQKGSGSASRKRSRTAYPSPRARKRSEQEKKQARRTVRARLLTFGIMTALLFLLSLGCLSLSVRGSSVVNPKITYQLGTKTDLQSVTSIRRSQLYRNGQLYVNFSEMSSYCNFTVAGDATCMRFIFNRSDSSEKQYVSFVLGSCVAEVNGQPVRMQAPSVEEDGDVLVPAAFVTTYLRGITVSVDEKTGAVTVAREQNTESDQTVTVRDPKKTVQYVDITCTLNLPTPCTRIAEASVPETNSDPVLVTGGTITG